jgi:hypothetical protein
MNYFSIFYFKNISGTFPRNTPAASESPNQTANNAWMSGCGERCILSDWFCRVLVYRIFNELRSKIQDFYFLFFEVLAGLARLI